ncbi:hypothetical protein Lfu02_76300 [Longispora fulva]|uniref:Uncharacterized protein n=1 Tax=Longispora fulva TaxID=619741 RepID=A0A8J7KLV1_9ACTN|nr:DUF6308 family protein [Longispora fulva]MBG6138411.1 hypothetical protein [Longispora fulva]GIG63258.1 hypothetical protein Lfu02_76300 [Longispora fulva]
MTKQGKPEMTPDWSAVDDLIANREDTLDRLREYFGEVDWREKKSGYTGAWFERFDRGGDRSEVKDRFTSADMIAVSMLSIIVPARAAWLLIDDPGGTFTQLLAQIPTDIELVDVDAPGADPMSACHELWTQARRLRGVGPTTASKLLARKRPHLLPVQDSVVLAALGSPDIVWEPLRQKLRAGLHGQLVELGVEAGVPDKISALRVLDVALWMTYRPGTDSGPRA